MVLQHLLLGEEPEHGGRDENPVLFTVYLCVSIALVLIAGLMSGLTLGYVCISNCTESLDASFSNLPADARQLVASRCRLMSLDTVELEVRAIKGHYYIEDRVSCCWSRSYHFAFARF